MRMSTAHEPSCPLPWHHALGANTNHSTWFDTRQRVQAAKRANRSVQTDAGPIMLLVQDGPFLHQLHMNTGSAPDIAMQAAMDPIVNTIAEEVIAGPGHLHACMRVEPVYESRCIRANPGLDLPSQRCGNATQYQSVR